MPKTRMREIEEFTPGKVREETQIKTEGLRLPKARMTWSGRLVDWAHNWFGLRQRKVIKKYMGHFRQSGELWEKQHFDILKSNAKYFPNIEHAQDVAKAAAGNVSWFKARAEDSRIRHEGMWADEYESIAALLEGHENIFRDALRRDIAKRKNNSKILNAMMYLRPKKFVNPVMTRGRVEKILAREKVGISEALIETYSSNAKTRAVLALLKQIHEKPEKEGEAELAEETHHANDHGGH